MTDYDFENSPSLSTVEGRDAYYQFLVENSPILKKERDMLNKRNALINNPSVYPMTLSGLVVVSDPCYSRDAWCAGVTAVKPGEWLTTVKYSDEGSWGIRVAELLCWHSDYDKEVAETADDELDFEVGVDSGQAGVFCDTIYPMSEEEQGDYGDTDTFYGKCCDSTCDTAENFGVIDGKGVCSSSGYGDGGYSAYVVKEDGVAVAIRIVFISDEQSEDEDEY